MRSLLLLVLFWSSCSYGNPDTVAPSSLEVEAIDAADINRLEKEHQRRIDAAMKPKATKGGSFSGLAAMISQSKILSALSEKPVLVPAMATVVSLGLFAGLARKFRPKVACPKCGNSNRKLLQISPASAVGAFPWRASNKYRCGGCGYRWRDKTG